MNIIAPLYKREDKKCTNNYRGISFLCSAYELYAEVSNEGVTFEGEGLELLGLLKEYI